MAVIHVYSLEPFKCTVSNCTSAVCYQLLIVTLITSLQFNSILQRFHSDHFPISPTAFYYAVVHHPLTCHTPFSIVGIPLIRMYIVESGLVYNVVSGLVV